MTSEARQRRVLIIALLAVAALVAVAARLLFLSLVRGPSLARMGTSYRVRVTPIPAARGKILDRNGATLVTNRPAYAAYYFSNGGPPQASELDRLAADLDMTSAAVGKEITSFNGPPYQPVLLKSDLTASELTRTMEDAPNLPGVFVNAVPLRQDTLGSVGGQVIGYVSRISKAELKATKQPGLTGNSVVGQTGLEKSYQKYLQGTDGGEDVEVNALDRPVKVLGRVAPTPGDNLVLTLNRSLEQTANQALAKEMAALRAKYGQKAPSEAGAVVVMDVHTGQILAMASLPSYNPNTFATGISAQAYQALLKNPASPFLDRAIQSANPPGSTYKMAVGMAGLLSGAINLNFTVVGKPRYWYPPYPKNWIDAYTGVNDIVKAIAQSNDIFFYEVGRLTGINAIAKYAGQFGFGKLTGIDLPGEVKGIVPTQAYYVKRNGAFFPGLRYSVAIGQGADEVTLMQLVRYVAAVATDGDVWRPYLVQRVVSPSGKTVLQNTPTLVNHINAPAADWSAIHRGMLGATKAGTIPGNGGTAGAYWKNFPMQVPGKTGTATSPAKGNITYFVSYAPYKNPQIAVAVEIDGGVEGALDSTVTRAIYDAYFHLNDPQPPFGGTAGSAVPGPPAG